MIKKIICISLIIILIIFAFCGVIYGKYILTRNFSINISTAPFYFDAQIAKTSLKMENSEATTELVVKNNNDSEYNFFETTYQITLSGNNNITFSVEGTTASNNTITKTISGGSIINDTLEITFKPVSGVTLCSEETVIIKIKSTNPYEKEITETIDIESVAAGVPDDMKIGDYVAYDCLAGTSGTLKAPVSSTFSGSGNQTVRVTEDRNLYTEDVETREWRVLSIEDNGEVLITTAAPELTSNTWNNKFSLKGRTGYLNGIEALNKAAQPYGQGTYAVSEKTRHITMEDVDIINGYTPSTTPNSKYLEQRKFWIDSENYIRIDDRDLPILEKDRKTLCIFYNGTDWIDLSTVEGKTVNITITDYEYTLKEETVGQQMLKYDGGTTTKSEYWLANSTISCFVESYIRYQIKKVESGSTSTKIGLFHSYRESNDEVQAGIRPVVTLKAGLSYIKDSNGVWQIEE